MLLHAVCVYMIGKIHADSLLIVADASVGRRCLMEALLKGSVDALLSTVIRDEIIHLQVKTKMY